MALYNLLIEQGATFERSLRLLENGVLLDLTGWSGSAQIRLSYEASTPLADFVVTVGSEGFQVSLSAAVTAALAANASREALPRRPNCAFSCLPFSVLPRSAYVWDFKAVDPQSRVFRYLEGGVLVMPQVTR